MPTVHAEYWHKDHLGNVRLTFADLNQDGIIAIVDDGSTPQNDLEILQVVAQRKSRTATRVGKNDYYPFGLRHPGELCRADTPPVNRYRYNGIEHVEDLGLNWDMAFYRSYDPAIGRWMQVDPLAEKYYGMTPYNGMGNNPILFSDPMGDTISISFKGTNILYDGGNLYNQDGSVYTGEGARVKKDGSIVYGGFLGQAKGALDLLSTTGEGSAIVGQLSGSTNNFVIAQKDNAANFVAGYGGFGNNTQINEAQAMRVLSEGKLVNALPFSKIGSGGTVYIDFAGLSAKGRAAKLGHELTHGTDADKGLLDSRVVPINGGLEQRQEIRAVYRANLIRQQLGVKPLRSQYSNSGPSLLNSSGQPMNVPPPAFPLPKLRF